MNHMATCMVTMTTLKQEDTKGKLYMEALNVGGMTMKKILTQNKCTGQYHYANNKYQKGLHVFKFIYDIYKYHVSEY